MKYSNPGARVFGVSVPIGAIRTAGGWRVGEYPDLVPFAKLCSAIGAGLVQILPVNDTGSQSSPYSALSAFALHPLYLRVRDLPEAAHAPDAVAGLDAFASEAERESASRTGLASTRSWPRSGPSTTLAAPR